MTHRFWKLSILLSILEQLAQATTSYQGKIALATENEAKTGTDANKAITSATLKAVLDVFLQSISGYDNTKVQVLKNNQGTLTWVDEA